MFTEDSYLGDDANYIDICDEVYTSDDTDDEESDEGEVDSE